MYGGYTGTRPALGVPVSRVTSSQEPA